MKRVNPIPGIHDWFYEHKGVYTLHEILQQTCKALQVSEDIIMEGKNVRWIVSIRQLFCYFASHLTEEKWINIGEFINTDHATAIRGARKISDFLDMADDITVEKVKRIYQYFLIRNNSMAGQTSRRYAVC